MTELRLDYTMADCETTAEGKTTAEDKNIVEHGTMVKDETTAEGDATTENENVAEDKVQVVAPTPFDELLHFEAYGGLVPHVLPHHVPAREVLERKVPHDPVGDGPFARSGRTHDHSPEDTPRHGPGSRCAARGLLEKGGTLAKSWLHGMADPFRSGEHKTCQVATVLRCNSRRYFPAVSPSSIT